MKKLLSFIILFFFLISLIVSVSTNFYYEISKLTGKQKFASTHISLPQKDNRLLEKIAEKEKL